MEVIVVFDDLSVKKIDITGEEEIPDALDSGFMNAFFRLGENNEIEYADVDFDTGTVTWKKPEYENES